MWVLLALLLFALVSIVWTTWRYGIGPTPTSPKVKSLLLKSLPKTDSGPIYELGAGFGTLAFALAERYPAASVIAIEVSPLPYLWMKVRNIFFPKKNLKIYYEDFFKLNLTGAKTIVCYLYPQGMTRLSKKLDQECPRATVITHTFALPDRIPNQVLYANDLYHTPLYIYEKRN